LKSSQKPKLPEENRHTKSLDFGVLHLFAGLWRILRFLAFGNPQKVECHALPLSLSLGLKSVKPLETRPLETRALCLGLGDSQQIL
jgi:hypothetical protein